VLLLLGTVSLKVYVFGLNNDRKERAGGDDIRIPKEKSVYFSRSIYTVLGIYSIAAVRPVENHTRRYIRYSGVCVCVCASFYIVFRPVRNII